MSIHGIDVSDHQPKVDWTAVKNCGIEFAFLKATEGVTWKASTFADKCKKAKEAGLICGAYHFFRPTKNGKKQAKNFFDVLDSLGGFDNNDLPPVLDIEVADGVSASTIRDHSLQWLEEVEKETQRKPIIYTSSGFWERMGSSREFAQYPLWIAHYFANRPKLTGSWKTAAIWQYTDRGAVKGIDGKIDLNWFNGTIEGLKAFASGDISGVKTDASFDNLINKGDIGEAVREVQQMLISRGFDVGELGADSDFGPATEAAVMKFQKSHNLPINGIVDLEMLKKLQEVA